MPCLNAWWSSPEGRGSTNHCATIREEKREREHELSYWDPQRFGATTHPIQQPGGESFPFLPFVQPTMLPGTVPTPGAGQTNKRALEPPRSA